MLIMCQKVAGCQWLRGGSSRYVIMSSCQQYAAVVGRIHVDIMIGDHFLFAPVGLFEGWFVTLYREREHSRREQRTAKERAAK